MVLDDKLSSGEFDSQENKRNLLFTFPSPIYSVTPTQKEQLLALSL